MFCGLNFLMSGKKQIGVNNKVVLIQWAELFNVREETNGSHQ